MVEGAEKRAPVKLNLGCGDKQWPGFINVDLSGAQVNCDLRKLPFSDEYADEIHAIHVIEHFYKYEIVEVLEEWGRVLRTGGKLVLELPCWNKVEKLITEKAGDRLTRNALYGSPKTHHEGVQALHKWCWSINELSEALTQAGFSQVDVLEPLFHVKTRDMRIEATK